MIVLHVVQSYYPATIYGGPIFSIHHTCQELARQGLDIRVATTNANGTDKLDVDTRDSVTFEDRYLVHYYDDTIINRFSWPFTRGLPGDIRSADVVHLQDVFSTYAAWCLLLAAWQGRPLVLSARGVLTPWGLEGKRRIAKKLWIELFVRPFVRDTQRVMWHATADSEKNEILAVFPASRVAVIPNGVRIGDLAIEAEQPRDAYMKRFFPGCAIPPGRARPIVGLGRLHAKKAFDVAIRAFERIARDDETAVLLIAGPDDGEGSALARLITSLRLEGRVALVGEVKGQEKAAFLQGAELFLFPTHNENFGNVVVEALAAGLPVVASREAPWPALDAAGAGLWVDNTETAFAAAARELMRRDREALRTAARAYAGQFDLAAVASAFKSTYLELLHAQRH